MVTMHAALLALAALPGMLALQDTTGLTMEVEGKRRFNTYIIAVPRRRERASHLLTTMTLRGHLHNATLKTKLNRKKLIKQNLVSKDCKISIGEIACTMSHKAVYRRFLADEKAEYALIFEDDAKVEYPINKTGKSVSEIVETLIESRPYNDNWDVLNLGRCFDHCCAEEGQTEGQKVVGMDGFVVLSSTDAYCAHSYLVTRQGAQKLLDHGTPIWNIIDEIIVHAGNEKKTTMRSLVPRLFTQEEKAGTLIHDEDVKKFEQNPDLIVLMNKSECEWETHCVAHRPKDYVSVAKRAAEMTKKYHARIKTASEETADVEGTKDFTSFK
ncbi:hypothetical protein AAMO2058_000685800 [Amorphochlora amoebiformis]